jgi:predicted ribosomally synthesized peptide with SipW-like signal peptide
MKNKIGVIFFVAILAIAGVGVSYAGFTDVLTISGTVSTGHVEFNIIEYSGRPFADLDEMHSEMLKRYNEVVKPDDVCIWVGDVGFAPDSTINKMLENYNGYKILIMGNHDLNHNKVRYLEFDEIYITYQVTTPEVNLCFTHYPMDNLPEPCINVHGHEHQHPGKIGRKSTHSPRHINVCCEYWDYTPVQLKDLI